MATVSSSSPDLVTVRHLGNLVHIRHKVPVRHIHQVRTVPLLLHLFFLLCRLVSLLSTSLTPKIKNATPFTRVSYLSAQRPTLNLFQFPRTRIHLLIQRQKHQSIQFVERDRFSSSKSKHHPSKRSLLIFSFSLKQTRICS